MWAEWGSEPVNVVQTSRLIRGSMTHHARGGRFIGCFLGAVVNLECDVQQEDENHPGLTMRS
jgi:hypothetical protein